MAIRAVESFNSAFTLEEKVRTYVRTYISKDEVNLTAVIVLCTGHVIAGFFNITFIVG